MALLSALGIINTSCAVIGSDPLETLDDETIGGQSAALLYETVVDFNLGIEPFQFGQELRQLSKVTLSDPPASGYDYVYDVQGQTFGPPRWLTDDPGDPDRRFWRYVLISGQVHASADPLFAMVKFRPDPSRWSATFRRATITALAAELASAIASDDKLRDQLNRDAYGTPSEQFRGGQMRAAITENSQSTPPRVADWTSNPLTRAWRS